MRLVALLLVVAVVAGACSGSDEQTFCDAVEAYAEVQASGAVGVEADSSMSDVEVEARVSAAERELRAQVDSARSRLDRLEQRAPGDVRADVTEAVSVDRRYFDALAANDFDLLAVFGDPSFVPGDATIAATERADAYTRAECGRPFVTVASRQEAPPPLRTSPPFPAGGVP